jgi:5-formyltetrahydrofolate cyclo-ligase
MTADKTELRRTAALRRAALARALGDVGERLAEAFARAVPPAPPRTVAGYAPVRSEADPTPILRRLAEAGWTCALPVVVDDGRGLEFRAWRPGEMLSPGRWGIPAPADSAPAVRPDVVLVPLLAYDGAGGRLGYGAGCYDRALAWLRRDGGVLAVGVAYAGQRMAAVPAQPHDERLDMVVTEDGAEDFGRADA